MQSNGRNSSVAMTDKYILVEDIFHGFDYIQKE